MKKLLVAAGIFASVASFGQNVFPTPTGNVGIGTTSPSAALHVWGGGREVLVGYSGTNNYNTRVGAASIFLNRPSTTNDPYAYSAIKQTGPGGIILDVASTPGYSDVNLSGDGNLGIGGLWRPMAKLHVKGGVLLETHDKDNDYFTETYFGIFPSDNADNVTADGKKADMIIGWRDQAGSGNFWTNQGNDGIRFAPNGQVIIGDKDAITTSGTDWESNFKLAVDGNIICEAVRVESSTAWPDYVFDNDHKLMSLDETAEYIDENNHLPNVPSAKDVKDQGIDVTEMLTIQMEKIEELTLHTIAQQKLIEELQVQLKK